MSDKLKQAAAALSDVILFVKCNIVSANGAPFPDEMQNVVVTADRACPTICSLARVAKLVYGSRVTSITVDHDMNTVIQFGDGKGRSDMQVIVAPDSLASNETDISAIDREMAMMFMAGSFMRMLSVIASAVSVSPSFGHPAAAEMYSDLTTLALSVSAVNAPTSIH